MSVYGLASHHYLQPVDLQGAQTGIAAGHSAHSVCKMRQGSGVDVLVMSQVAMVDSKHYLILLLEYCTFNCAFHSNIHTYVHMYMCIFCIKCTYVCM